MEETLHELRIPMTRTSEGEAISFQVAENGFTIRLYYNRFRMRTGFGYPGWLNPSDISDIVISPLDELKEPQVRMILESFVSRCPRKPWEFGWKVKVHSLGISGRTKKSWSKWLLIL